MVISCHFFHSPTEILRDPLMDFFLLVATTAGFDLAKKRCRCLKLLLTFASVVISLSFQCKKSLFFPCLKWDLHGFAVFGTLAKPPCLFSGYCCSYRSPFQIMNARDNQLCRSVECEIVTSADVATGPATWKCVAKLVPSNSKVWSLDCSGPNI